MSLQDRVEASDEDDGEVGCITAVGAAESRWSADELAPVGGRIAYPRSGGQMNLLEHVGRLREIGRGTV